jgi:hypothetical protein
MSSTIITDFNQFYTDYAQSSSNNNCNNYKNLNSSSSSNIYNYKNTDPKTSGANATYSNLFDTLERYLPIEYNFNRNPETLSNPLNNIFNYTYNYKPKSDLEQSGGSAGASGDPHFNLAGKQSFDFQGENNGLYNMLDNDDISLIAKFANYGTGGAKIMKDQDLEFKDEGINLVTHSNGSFEIFNYGEKIGNQTNYNTDVNLINLLKENDISLSLQKNILTTVHGNRKISQQMNGSYMNNSNNTLMKGDNGLLSQVVGALDNNADGNTSGIIDVNKDGKIDNNDQLKYDLSNQSMVHTYCAGSKCETITAEVESKILNDFYAGLAQGSAVKGFSTAHGYSARQWNEYVGEKLFTVNSDNFLV